MNKLRTAEEILELIQDAQFLNAKMENIESYGWFVVPLIVEFKNTEAENE
jgi:hypothetical protein